MWTARSLRMETLGAAVVGLLFAFLPYVFARNTGHLMLTIYLVPPCIGFCLHVITGQFADLPRMQQRIYWASALLIGMNYPYTAFFAAFLAALAGLTSLLKGRLRWADQAAVKYVVLIVLGLFVTMAPTFVFADREPVGRALVYGFKSPSEADFYGLRVRHLLVPAEDGILPGSHALYRLLTAPFEPAGESGTARLGLVGALGLARNVLVCVESGGTWSCRESRQYRRKNGDADGRH